jgi:uncharacterized surface protein with fasciclin (FAS1) repeats
LNYRNNLFNTKYINVIGDYNMLKAISKYFLLISFLMLVMSCSNNKEEIKSTSEYSKGQSLVSDDVSANNILQIAIGSPDHTTLVAAVQAAGLEDVLANAGPLTVFAPNNAAFDKLPEGVVSDLLKPENKKKLANIITYHAAPGTYKGNMIKSVMGIGQATGDKVNVEVIDGETFVNGAKILGTIEASNGVVHIIDSVLLPPEK